jgi:hypothetical protein
MISDILVGVLMQTILLMTLDPKKALNGLASRSIPEGDSGSGGTGETPYQLLHILANCACAERQSRCPTGAGVSRSVYYLD